MNKLKTLFAVLGVIGLLAGADTVRTQAQILTILGDNTTGQISPQDLRDAIVSQSVYGSIGATDSADTQATSATPAAVAGFDTNGPSNGTTPDNTTDDITIGANSGGDYEVHFHASFTGTTNETYTLHLIDDGAEVGGGCSASRKTSNADVGSVSFNCQASIAGGSVMEVFVESGGAATFDIDHAQFSLKRIE